MGHDRRKRRPRPALESLERRDEPAADLSAAGRVPTAGAPVWHPLHVDQAGVLSAEATPGVGSTDGLRLTIMRADDTVLMTAEGAGGNALGGRVTLHVAPGDYRLGVSAGRADSPYQLSAHVTEAVSPAGPLDAGGNPKGVAAGDLNGDQFPDLAAVSRVTNTVGVWLGNGDGTFRARRDFALPAGDQPTAVLIADVNADGRPDLVTANAGPANSVSVFLAAAQGGPFLDRQDFPVGGGPVALAAGDLNGDGRTDLVAANGEDQTLDYLRGDGNGGFAAAVEIPEAFEPSAVAVADVTGDGRADLVWAAKQSGAVKVLPGGATFDPAREPTVYTVGSGPAALTVADVTGDGRPDVVTADQAANSFTVLKGLPDGSLSKLPALAGGLAPADVVVTDVNRDGTADVIGANRNDTLDVFLGTSGGTFAPRRGLAAGSDQTAVAAADFNRDGAPDLVVANGAPGQLRLLLGNGDGTFLTAGAFLVGPEPDAVAVGDVDGDGFPDAVTANNAAGTIDVALGNGDGTFQPRRAFAVDGAPVSASLADLNNDGRLDAVTADRAGGRVSVLLGNGDGTFRALGRYAVGAGPQAVVAQDIDLDGIPDLVSADERDGTLSVLWGIGDGTFTDRVVLAVGEEPLAVAVADVNGDGRPDLLSADKRAGAVSVIVAAGGRAFAQRLALAVGADALPVSVAVGDVNGDGMADVAAGTLSGTTAIFLGTADHAFRRAADVITGDGPYGLLVADLNGDGRPDMATTDVQAGTVGVALGLGDGRFQNSFSVPVGKGPIYLATADLNADGRPDLVTANSDDSSLGVLLGPFADADSPTAASPLRAAPPRHSPTLVDLDGDGLTDSVIRDRSGTILFRKGQPDALRPFAAPRPLNDAAHPARDFAAFNTGDGRMAVAAIDLAPVAGLYRISQYAVNAAGLVRNGLGFNTPFLPTAITAGDLDGSGRDSLLVTHALDNRVTIALPGRFDLPIVRPTGDNPSAALLSDVEGDGRLDVLVNASVSGDVTVLHNDAGHTFAEVARFSTGVDVAAADAAGAVFSLRHSAGVAAGTFFTGGGPADLAVLLEGSHQLAVLKNNGRGGFENPTAGRMTPTTHGGVIGDTPGPVVSGLFDGDAVTDVAMLDRESGDVWVWRGRGDGTFEFLEAVLAGDSPAGLTAHRTAGAGRIDLYVGNPAGDVLRLAGNPDGTFDPPPPLTGTKTSVSATADGRVLVVNQKTGSATVQEVSAAGKTKTLTTFGENLKAPRDGLSANLNGGPSPDLIVVETGGNAVAVYRALGPTADGIPAFAAPVRYAVGTNPVAAVAGDVNGDGVQDLLVTNQGSNDVSVLFGRLAEGRWTATTGPRVRAGGLSPVGATLRDLDGDGRPELVVTNGLSGPGAAGGSLVAITDRGFGYFDDSRARVTLLPGPAVSPPVFTPNGGVMAVGGNLIGLDGGLSSIGNVFGGGNIRALDSLADGRLVAFRDGAVEVLTPDAAGSFQLSAELTPLTGIPSEPTALEVLETQSGLRVLAATAGSDQLFVFDLSAAQGPIVDGGPAESPVVSKTTVLSRDSLAVVVTLLAGGLPDGNARESSDDEDAAGGAEPSGREGVQVASAEDAAAQTPPADEPLPPSADAERELGGTRLYKPIEDEGTRAEKPSSMSGPVESDRPREQPIAMEVALGEDEAPAQENEDRAGRVTGTAATSDSASATTELWGALIGLMFLVTVATRPAVVGTGRPPLPIRPTLS